MWIGKKRMENKKRHRLLSLFLFGITAVCLFFLGQAYVQSVEHKELKKDLIQTKEETAGQESVTETNSQDDAGKLDTSDRQPDTEKTEAVTPPVILEKYRELYGQNSDLAGWLTVEGTLVDYPVMQCEDNEYYLHHDFHKEESKYGCLYAKDEADFAEGTNVIIYGHNMRDGSMFGDLDQYMEESFYREHPTVSFDTLYEERMYEIVAVFQSQVYRKGDDVFKYYQFYQADTKEEFDDFYENIKALSLYDTGVEAEFGDTFITLSTCAYHVEDGRFVVVAKRVQ